MKANIKIVILGAKFSACIFLILYLCTSFYYLSFDLREFSSTARGTIAGICAVLFLYPILMALTSNKE